MKTKLVASLAKSSSTALSALLLALSALTASALPIITDVIETGGDNEATDTVTAKWTGVTFSNGIDGEFLKPFLVPRFAEEVPAMVDRVHQWNGVATNLPLPSYLVGGEYIMIGNDNRDNNPFKLDVTVSVPSIVFLLVDNRQGDADNATPPQAGRPLSGWTNMTWVGTSGFVPVMNGLNRTANRAVPDEVGYDEGGDGVGPGGSIQTAASVYVKSVPAGTFTLLQADNAGQNMYGVVVKAASDPSAQANLPAEFGQTVNGFQDSFDGATLNTSWKARGPATNIYSLANGILSVTNAAGDPNHLLYEAAGYNSTNQEVLARIRINRFGTNDLARAGIGASVGITNSQGINYHFRNEGAGAVHTEFLDDARQWGPELSFKWQTNVWYWMRLKHEPNTATNVDAFAKIWVADGLTPEPVDWQSTWNYVTTGASPTVRSGFAGITAGSAFDGTAATTAVFDVDYILIKASGLGSIVAGASTPADTKIQILGLGAAALLGGPLTDPDGNGLDALGGATSSTWDWAGITSSIEPDFEGGENSFNIFDHKVGGGNDKWCCDDPTPGKPVWVSVQFRQAVKLTHFTVASGNDTPGRDPTDWAIQGSNDGITFSDIYHFFGITTPWTDRNQVVKFTLPTPAQAYRHIRYIAYDTPATLHQLNEIEYFGTLVAATTLELVQDPANTTVLESGTSTATFTANADGPKPITYQWLRNGVEIPGATNRSLTLNVNAGDSGAAISVRATDGTATVTSKTGTLTVTPDKAPPAVVSATTKGDPNTVTVVFSEAVSQATALNLANFSINNGALITDFAFGANASTVLLKTTTLANDKSYTLFVSDVADRAFVPNRITPNPTSIAINTGLGSLLVETFTGLTGTAVSDLLSAPKFLTNAVDLTTFITNFNYSPNLDNYGARISGYFIAPSNGVYRFFIRSDDASQLFMNTNSASSTDPVGKVLIASEPGCCAAYLATGTQTSVGITMNGGQRYYIEGLLKEGGGGDYLQVAFRESAVTTVPANTEFIAGQFLAAPSGPVQLSQQPLSLTVTELQGAKFSVVAQGAFPYSYQWKLNGTAIAGATGSSLSIASTALTQNGNVYSVEVKNAFSSVTSSNATLTVAADVAGPLLVSAVGSGSLTEMTLNFNEAVNLYSYPALAAGKGNVTLTAAAQRPAPVTNSAATGSGALSLIGNQLSFNITYQGLSGVATAFHFHAPATTEQAAGVVISLVPFSVGPLGTNGSIVGTVTLTTDQLNWLASGLIYVNIHTAANPGGEIRGQLPMPTGPSVTIPGLTVTGTKAGADGKSIVVTTSAQEAGNSYTASVTGVKDRAVAANAVAADSFASFTGWVSSTGYLLRQVYTGIAGGTVANLTASSKFPDSPDVTELLPSFEAPTGYADNYGQRVSGFVTAPETGNYTFFLSADDNAALYLSTDENADNKKLIAIETAWSDSRQWVTSGGSSVLASKRSDQFAASEWPSKTNITLTAGKRYYVEALQKEGGGGDNLGVTWKLPSQASAPTNGVPPIAGTFLSSAANPEVASITITKHPVSTTVTEGIGVTATFTLDATAKIGAATNQPVLIQWAKNGEVIAGANGKTYTTPQVTLANDQDLYVALVSVPGRQLFSRGAVLNVLGDTTAPMVVSANSYTRSANVTVVFSEPVSRATATNIANYKVSNGTAVTGAALTSPNTVELSLETPALPGNAVTVTAFDFDEGTGTTTTSKDGKLVGTSNGATFSTDSPSGAKGDSSIQFGPGQKITVADPNKVLAINSPDTSFTVQAWLKIPNQSDPRSVFFFNQGPGGRISTSITSTNIPGGVSQSHAGFVTTLGILDVPSKALFPVDNKWHHMAVVHENGKELRFYIDGALGDTVPYTRGVSFGATNQVFYFGSEPTGGLQYLGLLDRFQLSKGIVAVGELDSKAVRPPTIVTNLLVSINNTNQLWSYENTAKDLGTAWKDKAFNDSAWPKGAAILGVNPDNTHTNLGPIRNPLVRANGAAPIVTDYFRTHFNFSGNPAATKLNIDLAVDDGAILYLNGTEIYRFGVTNGQTFNSTTFFADHEANGAVNALDQPASVTGLSGAALVAGDNVLAVEVHQGSATSSDVVMGVNLTAVTDTAFKGPALSPLANGLVAYWNFDGNLADSASINHGTARGTTPLTYVDGKGGFGKAAQFNGTNFVEITGSSNTLAFANGSLSIAGWFRVDTFDKGWQALIAKGEGTSWRIARRDDGNKNNIGYAGGVGEGANDVPAITNGWHHFVAVTDATGAKFGTAIYVDGVIRGINTNKAVLAAGTSNLLIGENPGALNRQFKGALDDIALWNRVLTADEVSTLYNGGTGTPLSGVLPQLAPRFSIGLNFGANEAGGNLTNSTSVAGVAAVAQSNWNNLSGQNGTNATTVANTAGTSSKASALVTWVSNGTWASGSRGEPNGTNFAFGTTDHVLMEGYLDTGNATTTTITVASIPTELTSNGYDLYVYALGGVAGRGGAYRVLDGATKAVLKDYVRVQSPASPTGYIAVPTPVTGSTNYAAGNYLVFGGLKASSIILEATTVGTLGFSATPRAPVNAIQLIATPSSASAAPAAPEVPRLPAGLTLAVTGIKDGATTPNTIAANTSIPINTDPTLPIDFSQIVNGFQDDFNGSVLNPNWKARGPSTNIYSVANGMLSVGNAAGDPNHLLYEASGYNLTNQEVLARIRVTQFGNTDASRAGIGAAVGTNSQGINLHFRDNTQDGVVGKQFKLLDDARAWGPAGLKIEWDNNKWYWMRLKHAPNTATAQVDVFGKVWAADGVTQEPADYQMLWDRYPAATTRSGFAGITAGSIFVSTNAATSAAFDVDYILIKADGLPSMKPSGSAILPVSAGSDTLETVENTPVSVSSAKLLANDTGAGGVLSLTAVSAASSAGGTVTLSGTTVTYTPKTAFKGEDSFTYTVGGGAGPSATGKVVVTVVAASAPSQNLSSIIKSDAGPVVVQFFGLPNRTYKVQASIDNVVWTDIGTAVTTSRGIITFIDTEAVKFPQRFYRTVAP